MELRETPVGEGVDGIKTLVGGGFCLSSCHCNPRQSTTHTRVLLSYVPLTETTPTRRHTLYKAHSETWVDGPLLLFWKEYHGRDRGTPTILIIHIHVIHSMKPSADLPSSTDSHTPHLLIWHGQLVFATVNLESRREGDSCDGAGRW